MDKQHIIDEIRRTAEANGGAALGKSRFADETGIKEWDWSGIFWTKWRDALIEAGFAPNEMQGPADQEKLIQDFISIIRRFERWPTGPELKLTVRSAEKFASHNTYNRLGRTKAQRATTILAYCQERDGYDDVTEICQPMAVSGASLDVSKDESVSFGFVYLMKSGNFYKIGRSDAPGRREYDLGSHRPEGIDTVHTIKTDDPVGIEAYWHNRFNDKRMRGEWFDLTRDDVKAFKRRKFQ